MWAALGAKRTTPKLCWDLAQREHSAQMAGDILPQAHKHTWMLSRRTLRWRLAPPLPRPLPPLPLKFDNRLCQATAAIGR